MGFYLYTLNEPRISSCNIFTAVGVTVSRRGQVTITRQEASSLLFLTFRSDDTSGALLRARRREQSLLS